MLSDERITEELADILNKCGWRSPCDAQWENLREAIPTIRAALVEAAQAPAVPVMGSPVAYLVPCQTMTGDVDMKLSFEPSGAFVGHAVGERVPLYAAPAKSITQAELDAKDARIRELEVALEEQIERTINAQEFTDAQTRQAQEILHSDAAIAKERQL